MIISATCRRLKAVHASHKDNHWIELTPIYVDSDEDNAQSVAFHLHGPRAAERAAYIAAAINAANEMATTDCRTCDGGGCVECAPADALASVP